MRCPAPAAAKLAMDISDFDYDLPEQLIAQQPLSERDASRMLAIERDTQTWRDSHFKQLPEYLNDGDVLVINNTRVFPARLRARRAGSGGVVELLLLQEVEANTWEALVRPARRLAPGSRLVFDDVDATGEVVEAQDNGVRVLRFESGGAPFDGIIDQIGEPPLPPYIRRDGDESERDAKRYQTIYANRRGAIAAPTAGLHFTDRILKEIAHRGVSIAEITLHVGYGTFEPVRVTDVSAHRVLPERYSIDETAAAVINAARQAGRRIVAVGTTTTRALESSINRDGQVIAQSGLANLTVVPGYSFRAVDALLTNFHLPRSSLLLLVCAFAGREFVLRAYRHAVENQYRFYSYGDCMFIS